MDINMPELRGAADELGIDLDNLLPAIEDAILGAYSKVPGAIRGAHVGATVDLDVSTPGPSVAPTSRSTVAPGT